MVLWYWVSHFKITLLRIFLYNSSIPMIGCSFLRFNSSLVGSGNAKFDSHNNVIVNFFLFSEPYVPVASQSPSSSSQQRELDIGIDNPEIRFSGIFDSVGDELRPFPFDGIQPGIKTTTISANSVDVIDNSEFKICLCDCNMALLGTVYSLWNLCQHFYIRVLVKISLYVVHI